jgi:hypothetical protein
MNISRPSMEGFHNLYLRKTGLKEDGGWRMKD